jgi:hypothetical protein
VVFSILIMMFAASRLCHGLSTDGLSPEIVLGHRLSSGGRQRKEHKENHEKGPEVHQNKGIVQRDLTGVETRLK